MKGTEAAICVSDEAEGGPTSAELSHDVPFRVDGVGLGIRGTWDVKGSELAVFVSRP
jgi:hypothetical protein